MVIYAIRNRSWQKEGVNGWYNLSSCYWMFQVDLVKDKIEFDGEVVTLPDNRLKPHLRRRQGDEDDDVWDDDDVPTKYCAKIDGGLLIDLTRNREKERGTYIDKSPFILKKGGGGLGSGGSSDSRGYGRPRNFNQRRGSK